MNEKEAPEPALEDDQEYDQLWDETEYSDDDLDSGEPSAVPDPEPSHEPEPEPAPAPVADPQPEESEDIDSLRHKLKSAEGRFTKFEDHISQLKDKITNLESRQPEPEPESESEPTLPEGWSKEDWSDFAEDNPAQAEILQTQNREVQQLKEKLETTENQRQDEDAARQFRSTILSTHSDYDELLANKRDDIVSFIDSQANPILKSTYQQIYQRGTAEQVVQLVSDYKESRKAPKKAAVDDRRINDALAVPSRSSAPRADASSGVPDRDDEDAAWDYFKDDDID